MMSDSKCCGGCAVHKTCGVLLIIGGLNWGLVGLGMLMGNSMDAWNVVHIVLGFSPTIEGIVYVLVGIAAIMEIFRGSCKKCKEACASNGAGNMDKKM